MAQYGGVLTPLKKPKIKMVKKPNPDAFYSVEDVKYSKAEDFLPRVRSRRVFGGMRKGK